MKVSVKLVIAIAIVAFVLTVAWIAYICYPGEARSASPAESSVGSIVGLLFIIAVITFFGYQISKKIPSNKIPNIGNASFAPFYEFLKKFGKWALAIIVALLIWYYWPFSKKEPQSANQSTVAPAPYVQSDNAQIIAGPGSDNDPIIEYGHHHFEKGVWYRYLVSDNRKYYFTHKLDETIVDYRPFGNGDVWYEVRFTNQSDDVEVTNKRPK